MAAKISDLRFKKIVPCQNSSGCLSLFFNQHQSHTSDGFNFDAAVFLEKFAELGDKYIQAA